MIKTAADFNHLIEIFASGTDVFNLDHAKNFAHQYLLLAFKELHLCSLALDKDLVSMHFNLKNKVNRALKEAVLLFEHGREQ